MREGRKTSGRGPIQATIGWAALVVVLVSALALGGNRPMAWVPLGLIVLALLAAQSLFDVLSRRPPAPGAARLWLAALLYAGAVAWGFLQTVPGWAPEGWLHPVWTGLAALPGAGGGQATVSADPAPGRHHVIRLATYGAVFWIMVQTAADGARARAMVQAVALFSGALAAFGIVAWATGNNPILGDVYARDVVKASFVNRNSYATYAAFGGLANLAALAMVAGRDSASGDEAGDARRSLRDLLEAFFGGGWLFALGALLCFAALAMTQSRGGAAAGLAGTAVFLAAYRRRGDAAGAALVGASLVILGFVAFALSSGLTGRLLTAGTESLRFLIYPEALDQTLERPWLGHGLGAFHEVFRERVPLAATEGEWDLAHNAYLENLFELGLPAAAALYAALALVVGRLIRGVATRKRNRLPSCLALAATAAAAVHSLVDFSLQMPATAALYAALAGIGWAQSHPRRHLRAGEGRSVSSG